MNMRISAQKKKRKKEAQTNKTVKYILLGVLVLFALPIAGPLAIGLLAVAFGILIAVIAVILSAIIVVGVLVVVGIALIVAGISIMTLHFASGLALVGIGLITGIIGVVVTVGAVYGCAKLIPAIFGAVVKLCKKPFEKRKAVV